MKNNPQTTSPHPFWLPADWPAPAHIKAGTTTRHPGISAKPYDYFNLAAHVGDDQDAVLHNRALLKQQLALHNEPVWLQQAHGHRIVDACHYDQKAADGSYTNHPGRVCVVLTADCVPVLICNKTGTEIAAIHVGWRGFCEDIMASALAKFHSSPAELLIWLGPHISAKHYEVGDEVKRACIAISKHAEAAFTPGRTGHFFANLERLIRIRLEKLGATRVFSSGLCTYTEEKTLFSHRREKVTGRMASLIWIDTWPG